VRVIEKQIAIRAVPTEVWHALTTNEGVRTFFAPDSDIELAVGGKYEIFFNRDAPYGGKGSEGCRVVSFTPNRMLTFTWNAPPSIPTLRNSGAYTKVMIELASENEGTKVKLSHFVDKEGEDWDRYYQYFSGAWEVVLGRLNRLFTSGPIDWEG